MHKTIFLAAAGIVVAGIAAVLYAFVAATPDVLVSSTTYRNDADGYVVAYPSAYRSSLDGHVLALVPADGSPFGYTVSAVPTVWSDTEAYVDANRTEMSPVVEVGGFAVVSRRVQVDSDGMTPIYADQLRAVRVANGRLYQVDWRNNESPSAWLPNLDAEIIELLLGFNVIDPPVSEEDRAWDEANRALAQFLGLLSEGTYGAAAGRYGGDLDALRSWAPTMDPNDAAALLAHACASGKIVCLRQDAIVPIAGVDGGWTFRVTFANPDGSPYRRDDASEFTFVVRRGDGGLFFVETLPPAL
jgi:hypothetical protein